MPFKLFLSQNNPSKHNPKLKMKTSLEVLNIICPATGPHMCRALSLQEVELDGSFLILHTILKTWTIYMSLYVSLYMSFVFHLYILGLTAWIWTNLSIGGLKFENPSKWNSYEGLNLDHFLGRSSFLCWMDERGIFGWRWRGSNARPWGKVVT